MGMLHKLGKLDMLDCAGHAQLCSTHALAMLMRCWMRCYTRLALPCHGSHPVLALKGHGMRSNVVRVLSPKLCLLTNITAQSEQSIFIR
jgi:hypothetical protein